MLALLGKGRASYNSHATIPNTVFHVKQRGLFSYAKPAEYLA